jgi:predicted Zn-dependent protease
MSELLDVCDEVLRLVDGRAECEVTASAGTLSLTRFANSFIHQNVGEEFHRVALRVSVDGRLASATTTRSGADDLRRLVDETIAAARLRPVDPDWPGVTPPGPPPPTAAYDEATDRAAPDERANAARDFVRAAPDLRAAGYCMTSGTATAFANSGGQRVEGRVTEASVDGIHQTATSAGSAHRSSNRLAEIDGDAVGSVAADRARRSVDARDLDPGDYEVILLPVAAAEVFRFLGHYGFNGRFVTEGTSFVHLGEQQFDPSITLTDDVTDRRSVGLGFDSEGTPKLPLTLVAGGVTTAAVHDRRSGGKAGSGSTGHANAEMGDPVPSNLVVTPGPSSFNELVAGLERGLIVTELHYSRVLDPKSLVVTGLTRNGTFLVEDGRVVGAAGNLRFTQSFVDALGPGRVRGIGNDGLLVTGDVWVPSVHLSSWSFTGGARG